MTLEQGWPRLPSTKTGGSTLFFIGIFLAGTHAPHHKRLFLNLFPCAASCGVLLNATCAMESPVSCVSTTSSSDESFAHDIWNPLMEPLFHVQICGIFEPFTDETDLARIALVILPLTSVTRCSRCRMMLKRAPLPALCYGTISTPMMKCQAGRITWVFACPGQGLVYVYIYI